jgi:hypothetical protein
MYSHTRCSSSFSGLMSDPEIAAGMQNPKIQAAFQEMMGSGGPMGMMSNPGKIQEMMADPEIGPFLQKLSEFRYPHKVLLY